mgnify:CR=1 FL=1
MSELTARGALLAFDFGVKRIGVAVGDWETRLAHPLEAIHAEDNATRFGRIGALIAEWQPIRLVVGLPLSMEGETHDLTLRARRFANQLTGRFTLPVTLVDERLSSFDADQRLREAGVRLDPRSRARKGLTDTVAAQQILQDFFDQQTHAAHHPAVA